MRPQGGWDPQVCRRWGGLETTATARKAGLAHWEVERGGGGGQNFWSWLAAKAGTKLNCLLSKQPSSPHAEEKCCLCDSSKKNGMYKSWQKGREERCSSWWMRSPGKGMCSWGFPELGGLPSALVERSHFQLWVGSWIRCLWIVTVHKQFPFLSGI